MTFDEAKKIAENSSECLKVGKINNNHFCNEITGTWWINLSTNIKNCSPACVIDVETKSSTVNYRCYMSKL